MKLVELIGNYRIYSLSKNECRENYKPFPIYVCWEEELGTINHNIGNLSYSENESDTLEDMIKWCKDNS